MKALLVLFAVVGGTVFGWILYQRWGGAAIAEYTIAVAPRSSQTFIGPPISQALRSLALRDLALFADQREIEHVAALGVQSADVEQQTARIEDRMRRLTFHEPKKGPFYRGDRLLLMQVVHARTTVFESAWTIHADAGSAARERAQRLAGSCTALAKSSAESGRFVGWHDDRNRACLNVPDDADLDRVLAAALAYTDNQLASANAQASINSAR